MNYEELNTMHDHELKELEDSYLLQRESDPMLRIKHTGGRFVLLALAAAIWVIVRYLLIRASVGIKPQNKAAFSLVTFFISLGLSGFLSLVMWQKLNGNTRFVIRYAVHYWPVTLYLLLGLVTLLKG